jgi:hypothetical protein
VCHAGRHQKQLLIDLAGQSFMARASSIQPIPAQDALIRLKKAGTISGISVESFAGSDCL